MAYLSWMRGFLLTRAAVFLVVGGALGAAIGVNGALALVALVELDPRALSPLTRAFFVVGFAVAVGADQAVQLVKRKALAREITVQRRAIGELSQALVRSERSKEGGATFPVWVRWPYVRSLREALVSKLGPDVVVIQRDGAELRVLNAETAAIIEAELQAIMQRDEDEEVSGDTLAQDDLK